VSTLETLLGEGVRLGPQVSGGDIAQTRGGETESGREVLIKSAAGLPEGLLQAEAQGLDALRDAKGCRIPEVVAVDADWLVLEWIERGPDTGQYWELLGTGLARQHRVTRPAHGFEIDNFIGKTRQENPETEDWVAFFSEHRLGAMQRMLRAAGRLSVEDDAAIDRLRGSLDRWLALPEEKPALLHGDLWGGNAMPGPVGRPVLYDPAVYFGSREADLAMTRLFGGFSGGFYSAYEEAFPLVPGFGERVELYNLYHTLNHALMFGGGYMSQSMTVVHRYAG